MSTRRNLADEADRCALVVIDAQNDFIAADGAIGDPNGATDTALERVCELVTAAHMASVPVIFTQELHRPQRVDFGRELDGDEPIHCIEGSWGADFTDRLRPLADDHVVRKRRYSAFFATDLDLLLRGLGVETLIVCGFVTDVCVHYTCVDAHQHDYRMFVVRDGVSGTSPAAHAAALAAVEYLQQGAVIDTATVTAAFGHG